MNSLRQTALAVVCWKRKWFVECAGLSGLHGLYGGRDRSERHHFASRRLIATVFNKPPLEAAPPGMCQHVSEHESLDYLAR